MIEEQKKPDFATSLERPPGFALEIEQPQKGYRYNQDPFHLAEFIKQHAQPWQTQLEGRCLDIGCGVGILPLLLAQTLAQTKFTGVEIQNNLALLAQNNVIRNHLTDRIDIFKVDYRDFSRDKTASANFQTVICNPPYYPPAAGRINSCPQKSIARHEMTSNLASLTQAAAVFLDHKGLFITVFPAERLLELSFQLKAVKLEPKVLQFIHPENSDRATMLLLAARKNGAPGIKVEPPLII
jgi:tRNA1Val (adenine37-N6)-methyltransferase